jgi:hypothetical protein
MKVMSTTRSLGRDQKQRVVAVGRYAKAISSYRKRRGPSWKRKALLSWTMERYGTISLVRRRLSGKW